MTDMRVADTLIGTLVDGRYRVRDRVARGGMATVYTATDERLERTVALKIIHPGQATDPQFVERFIGEAKVIARLMHPNVVAAYDQGTHEGLPYLVMEYVAGRTLREILGARRRLTPVEALAMTEQMLAAIAAAHRAGLVHRDIKPENVLVAEAPSGGAANLVDSVVKVADFGLAQAVASSTPAPVAAAADPAPVLATAAYVPPELVRDGHADPRSDVYSVGIVLFEMLTGRVPFDGPKSSEVAWQHVEQHVPPPSAYVSGLPPALDDLVTRATRRDPTDRPTDAGALLAEVQAVREEVTTTAVRPAAVRPRSGGGSGRATEADATVVMSPVAATERPSWARLPSPKARPAGPGRPAGTVVTSAGHRARGGPGGTAVQRNRVVVAAVIGVLGVLLAIGGWWLGFGRWEAVPDLVGMAEAEAEAAAEEQGLRVEFTDPELSDLPEGHVVAQDPDDGRVVRGGTVTLTLSQGPMPDVVGTDFEDAKRQLESLGLVVVEAEPAHSTTVPEGRVISVEPEAGAEVRPGDQVTITVSKGRPPINIPSVVGKRVDEASRELEAVGLEVDTRQVESDEPEGQVVGQDPEAGAGAEPGDRVTLEVSEGPPTRPVPDVIGQRCDQAIDTLEGDGFAVVRPLGDDGRVLLQTPSQGTGLPSGSQVTIWCG